MCIYKYIFSICLLGCANGCDAQHHFVYCTHIRNIQDSLLPRLPPSGFNQVGIVDPTRHSLLTVVATFAASHAVKRSPFTSGLDRSPLNSERNLAAQLIFADAFIAAAHDAGLGCRAAVHIPLIDHQLNSAASSGRAYIKVCIYIYVHQLY